MTDLVIAVGLVLLGALGLLFARRGTKLLRRITDHPVSPVAELRPGLAEVVGVIRAVGEPLRAFDGTPVVALERSVEVRYRSNGRTASAPRVGLLREVARAELSDPTGTCVVELEHVLDIRASTTTALQPAELAERDPDLYRAAAASVDDPARLEEIRIEETLLLDGAEVFAAGEAVADDSLVPGGDYRGARPRMRLRGRADLPLVVSPYGERYVRERLGRPAALLVGAAVISWLTAAALLSARFVILAIAG